MSYTSRIILTIILISMIPLAAFGYIGATATRSALEKFIYDRVSSVNDVKINKIKEFVSDAQQTVTLIQNSAGVVAAAPTVLQNAEALKGATATAATKSLDTVLTTTRLTKDIDDIKIIGPTGRIVYTNNPKYVAEIGTTAVDALKTVAKDGQSGVHFSPVFHDAGGDELFELYVAGSLRNADGQTVGTLVIEAELDELVATVTDVTGMSETGESYFGYNDGYSAVVLSPLKYDQNAALSSSFTFGDAKEVALQNGVRGLHGRGKAIDYRGKEVLAVWDSYEPLKWGVVTKIDATEAYGPILSVRTIMLVAVPISIGLMILLVFIITSLFLRRPLNHLTKVAESLSNGKADVTIDPRMLYKQDEFGHLATYLQHISHRLKYEQKLDEQMNIKK